MEMREEIPAMDAIEYVLNNYPMIRAHPKGRFMAEIAVHAVREAQKSFLSRIEMCRDLSPAEGALLVTLIFVLAEEQFGLQIKNLQGQLLEVIKGAK